MSTVLIAIALFWAALWMFVGPISFLMWVECASEIRRLKSPSNGEAA